MKVITFGTFDVLHKGHEYYLRQAKKLGDELIVVVARDENVEMNKKEKPYNSYKQRIKQIEKLKIADKVIPGDKADAMKCLKDQKPDIIALGYDQRYFIKELRNYLSNNKKIKLVRIGSYFPNKYKSSIIKKINKLK